VTEVAADELRLGVCLRRRRSGQGSAARPYDNPLRLCAAKSRGILRALVSWRQRPDAALLRPRRSSCQNRAKKRLKSCTSPGVSAILGQISISAWGTRMDSWTLPHIILERCNACGCCVEACVQGVLQVQARKPTLICDEECDGCGRCEDVCEQAAIALTFEIVGAD
jgi:NAD-dependent dihydropyrimidine dehydrogenase PreA subunit